MTDATFCDIHGEGNNVVPKIRTMKIVLQQFSPEIAKKVGRKNVVLQATLDGCNPCITAKLIQVAKSHGVDIENMWRIEQLVPPKKGSKSKKWSTVLMTPDEWVEYQLEYQRKQEELADLEREEQTTPRQTVAPIPK